MQAGWPVNLFQLASVAPLRFVGIAEEYEATLCLFLYQAGRFPHAGCSCDAARTLRPYLEKQGHDLTARHWHLDPTVVMPELRISREALEARNPHDVALYRDARTQFERRVKLVEERMEQTFLHCASERKTRLWDPSRL